MTCLRVNTNAPLDKKNYSISFVHCNANWEPSDLMVSEFMTGFFEANILNFDFST
ncbi:MAG: DUF5103 domain-containing protein, partial [Ignavibacterium sp.]